MTDPSAAARETAANAILSFAAIAARTTPSEQEEILDAVARALDAFAAARVAEERARLIVEMEGKVFPVLEACRRLFGGQGLHGPGALEDDCAFAIRVIQRLRAPEGEVTP